MEIHGTTRDTTAANMCTREITGSNGQIKEGRRKNNGAGPHADNRIK